MLQAMVSLHFKHEKRTWYKTSQKAGQGLTNIPVE